MHELLTADDKLSCIAAARWVSDQQDVLEDVTPAVIHLLETMIVTLRPRCEPLFLFELWFGLGLEMLVIPPCASRYAMLAKKSLFKGASLEAFQTLGAAIKHEMVRTNNDLLVHEDDGGTEVLVFDHRVRDTMLLATGIILPEEGLW